MWINTISALVNVYLSQISICHLLRNYLNQFITRTNELREMIPKQLIDIDMRQIYISNALIVPNGYILTYNYLPTFESKNWVV